MNSSIASSWVIQIKRMQTTNCMRLIFLAFLAFASNSGFGQARSWLGFELGQFSVETFQRSDSFPNGVIPNAASKFFAPAFGFHFSQPLGAKAAWWRLQFGFIPYRDAFTNAAAGIGELRVAQKSNTLSLGAGYFASPVPGASWLSFGLSAALSYEFTRKTTSSAMWLESGDSLFQYMTLREPSMGTLGIGPSLNLRQNVLGRLWLGLEVYFPFYLDIRKGHSHSTSVEYDTEGHRIFEYEMFSQEHRVQMSNSPYPVPSFQIGWSW